MLNTLFAASYSSYAYGFSFVDWTEVYGLIASVFTVAFVVIMFFLTMHKRPFGKPDSAAYDLVNILNFNCSFFERVVKAYTLAKITFEVLMIPTDFDNGVLVGFKYMFYNTFVLGILGTLMTYVVVLQIYKIANKFTALNKHLEVKEPEPVYYAPAPVNPAYAPYQQGYAAPAAPVAPVAPTAPVAPVAPAAPAAPVAPVAPVAPAAPAVPTPVEAAPAPAEDATKACTVCGKEIKAAAKFCPFCGNNQ